MDSDGSLLEGKTCIAADDHPINLQLITQLLQDMGATVLQATDGDEAVLIAEQNDVDMAFLDVHMPRMNGLEAARRIQKQSRDQPMRIVALTADAAEKNRRDIARAGIQRVLIKPVSDDDLRKTVKELLTGHASTSTSDAPTSEPIGYDLPLRDEAQALRIAGGSKNVADKLFAELCAELPQAIADLRSKLDARDWPELWQLTHRLHGAAAVCGVPALYHALGEMQPAVSLEDEPAVGILLDRVDAEAQRMTANQR